MGWVAVPGGDRGILAGSPGGEQAQLALLDRLVAERSGLFRPECHGAAYDVNAWFERICRWRRCTIEIILTKCFVKMTRLFVKMTKGFV